MPRASGVPQPRNERVKCHAASLAATRTHDGRPGGPGSGAPTSAGAASSANRDSRPARPPGAFSSTSPSRPVRRSTIPSSSSPGRVQIRRLATRAGVVRRTPAAFSRGVHRLVCSSTSANPEGSRMVASTGLASPPRTTTIATIQMSIRAAARANGPATPRVRMAAQRNRAPSPAADGTVRSRNEWPIANSGCGPTTSGANRPAAPSGGTSRNPAPVARTSRQPRPSAPR